MKVLTIAEAPDLRPRLDEADAAAYPEFVLHSEFGDLWDAVYGEFPEYQFVMIDEDGVLLAHANSVPFAWNQSYDDLPATSSEMVARALDDKRDGAEPTALGALQAVVHPAHQGGGLSSRVLAAMAGVSGSVGLPDLFAPIRPTMKPRYPLVPMKDYATWKRDDGLPYDSWLRVHDRLGATVAGVAEGWTTVTGPIAQWEIWTGMIFPQSGTYTVPGGLVPVEIDVERNLGRYVEPHLWMHYRIPLWESGSAIEFLGEVPMFADLPEDSIRRLAQLARPLSFEEGARMIEADVPVNEEDDGFYVIVSGTAAVQGADGRLIARLGPGDFFGEMAILDEAPRSAAVVAVDKIECLAFRRADFVRNLRLYPDIGWQMMRTLSSRLRQELTPQH